VTYSLNPIDWTYEDLEPHVPAADAKRHREGVHQAYIDALNALVADNPELAGKTVEELLRGIDDVPRAVRQQTAHLAGGHANHQFLWKVLGPASPRQPVGELAAEIDRTYGSFGGFRSAFEAAAAGLGVEGWVFLSLSRPLTGDLEIVALPGNGSVLPIAKPGILICDLWDHGTGRPAFPAYWDIVDWNVGEYRYTGLRVGKTHL
jgi:Fe-Mn family superoxide dismutase